MSVDARLVALILANLAMILGIGSGGASAQSSQGPVVEVDSYPDGEQPVPVFVPFEDAMAVAPNHPPFSEIPPMPMDEDLAELKTSLAIETNYIHDARTQETLALPMIETNLFEALQQAGYAGVDGGIDVAGDDYLEGFGTMSMVSDTSIFPRRMNCKLVMRFTDQDDNDRFFVCSGSMIDAETVVTAGHCVYARDPKDENNNPIDIWDWAKEIYVYPGWDGSGSVNPPSSTVFNYGWGRGSSYMAGSGWVDLGSRDRDIALVRITRAVGMLTGWFGWSQDGSCETVTARDHSSYSFPAEDCPLADLHNGHDMYYWSGTFDSCYSTNQLQLATGGGNCFDTVWGGMNGSAAYYQDGDERFIHAIASTSNRNDRARYTRLWQQFVDDMNSDFIPGSRGIVFDLQALQTEVSPMTVAAGNTFDTRRRFVAANATNNNPSHRTYRYHVYLSQNDNITGNDTHLGTYAFDYDFSSMEAIWVNMPPFVIPNNTPAGTYWIGVILDSATDTISSNNDTDGWDARQITVVGPPEAIDWRSVRAHEGLGDLYIRLDPLATGNSVVSETRSGGVRRLEIEFSEDITGLLTGSVEVEDLTNGGFVVPDSQALVDGGTLLVLQFDDGLPDEACYRVDLSAYVPGISGDPDCGFRVLAGDVIAISKTNFIDVSYLKSKISESVLPDNIRLDLNLDGLINMTDVAAVKGWAGSQATCP